MHDPHLRGRRPPLYEGPLKGAVADGFSLSELSNYKVGSNNVSPPFDRTSVLHLPFYVWLILPLCLECAPSFTFYSHPN